MSFQDFGSFARRTKTRPLDDIDLIEFLNDCRDLYWDGVYNDPSLFRIRVADSSSVYWKYTNDDGYLNSTKILNRLKKQLEDVENYNKAEIKRNGVAIVLNLSSYDWSFDIVPGFRLRGNNNIPIPERLIPNGNGEWMKSEPQFDQVRISEVNKRHNSTLIPIIRLLKYWNVNTKHARRVGSYHLETMLIDSFNKEFEPISIIRRSVPKAFNLLSNAILYPCPDPKGLSSNLDEDWTSDERQTLSTVATEMAERAEMALEKEDEGDHKRAITWWNLVFPNFPEHE